MFDINQRKLYPKSEYRQTNTIKTQRKRKLTKEEVNMKSYKQIEVRLGTSKLYVFLLCMFAHSLNEYHTTVIGSFLISEWSIKNQRFFRL